MSSDNAQGGDARPRKRVRTKLPPTDAFRPGGVSYATAATVASEVGLDQALTDDALVAICQHLNSAGDLLRLSRTSRMLLRICRSEAVWRLLFQAQRGEDMFEAMNDVLQFHGNDAVGAFLSSTGDSAPPSRLSSIWREAFFFTGTLLPYILLPFARCFPLLITVPAPFFDSR
jgi:hypothetical protein